MPLDPSIIMSGQLPQIQSPVDAAKNAMTMTQFANAARENNEQQALRDSYHRNTSLDKSGQPVVNRQAVLSDLAQVNPMKAQEVAKQFQQQDIDKQNQIKIIATNLIHNISDTGEGYQEYRNKMMQLDPSRAQQLPEVFDPSIVNRLKMASMDFKDQMQLKEKQQEFQMREKDRAVTRDDLGFRRDQAKEAKNADLDRKDSLALEDHLAKGWTARSGAAGQVQSKILAGERAQQLIDQGKGQKNGLDSRQIEELAQSTSNLLGGGAAASARIEALVPHTMFGRAQGLKEWLTNNPQGTGQEEFVKRMEETVNREKKLAETQKSQFQIEGLPAHYAFQQRNPDQFNRILRSKGISNDMIDENGRFKAPPKDSDEKPSWAK